MKHGKPAKVLFISVIVCILASGVFACMQKQPNPSPHPHPGENDKPLWSITYTLPQENDVKKRLTEIYGSEEKMYLLSNAVQRMPCPENGAKIAFNMTYGVNAYVRAVLEDAVDEMNEVFAVVNPNYKFEMNYAPRQEDFAEKHSVRMTVTDNFSSPTVMGTAQMSTGTFLGNFGITLKDTTLEDLRYLMLTFRHEFMHLLGAGDAYDNPDAEKTTVMQNYNNTTYRHFSSSDVAFIDAYYRNPNNPLSDERIKEFIADYEKENAHTQTAVMSKLIGAALGESDVKSQTADKHYADTTEAESCLNQLPDADFGKSTIRFSELAYAEGYEPEKIYSGKFDVDGKKYWEYKNGNGMGVSYTDIGKGMLIAMPGGTANITLFIRLGSYVFAFRPVGMHLGNDYNYFIKLDELSLNLLRIYAVN